MEEVENSCMLILGKDIPKDCKQSNSGKFSSFLPFFPFYLFYFFPFFREIFKYKEWINMVKTRWLQMMLGLGLQDYVDTVLSSSIFLSEREFKKSKVIT